MEELKNKMDPEEYRKFTEEGYFTIRRSDKFWCGILSDMATEQILMRALKSRGGMMRGRGHLETKSFKWLDTRPFMISATEKVHRLCKVSFATSEHHVDARLTRISKDVADFQKFVPFFEVFKPFVGRSFADLKYERKNKITSLAAAHAIKLKNEKIVLNPTLIFRRISLAMEKKVI